MECPKCKHVQADGLSECHYCGVIFSRIPSSGEVAPERLVRESTRAGSAAVEDEKSPASFIAVAVFLLLLVGIGGWLNFPSSSKPQEASYIDKEKSFAFVAPGDWLMINPANFKAITNEYSGRFPRHLQQFLSAPGFAVGFFKIQDKEGQLPPSLNVIALSLKKPLPPLDESEKEEATRAITGEISRQIDSYKLLSSAIIKVDKQAALQLVSTASIRMILSPRAAIMSEPTSFNTRYVVGYTDEVAKDIEFKSIQTLFPGRDWAFILSCTYDIADSLSAEAICQTALESFRVGKRPPRFGSVVMGSLNGALIAACGYLLFILMGRAWRRE